MKDAVLNRLFLRYRERGDGKALAAVFDLTAKELYAVAAHLARDAAEAEDLVQVVFLRAMERASAFDPAHGLRPWLHGILWREALAARRRAARRIEPEELERASGADPAELAAEGELPTAVRAALAELPQRYREVVEPLLFQQKPAHEIAAALGRSSGTVRMQIHRGLERLRRALPRGLSAYGLAALPTRGWQELRRTVLREAGVSSQAVGALSTGVLATQAALAAAPALWFVPLVASGAALVAVRPQVLPFSLTSSEPAPLAARTSDPKESDPMKPSSLVALPVVLGLATSPEQDTPGREPVVTATVEDKVASLDALVGELLALSQPGNANADEAWAGLLAAKKRIDEERARRVRASEVASAESTLTQDWVEAVTQLADPARRRQALDEIAAALASGQEELQLAACQALSGAGDVKFERGPFRAPVLALARSAQGQLRVSALFALLDTERRPEDLALAMQLVEDPSPAAGQWGVYLLHSFSDGDLTGEAGTAALQILDRLDERERRQAIGGLWGARVSPAIEERVLAWSRSPDREDSHDAVYFGLSTFANKSRAVVERLIELTSDRDFNQYQRALWGLGQGVAAEDGPLVVEAMQRLFEARISPQILTDALQLVGQYGTADVEPWLQRIESNPAQPDSVREAARAALAALRER